MKEDQEKVIQIISFLESSTQQNLVLGLTSDGRIFKSYDLLSWELIVLPDLSEDEVKVKEDKLSWQEK